MKYASDSQETHYLYVKEDTGASSDSRPKGRTLFVVNVPPYVTEVSIHKDHRSNID